MKQEILSSVSSNGTSKKKKKSRKRNRNRNEVSKRTIVRQIIVILIILALLGLVRWYGG